jgi:hypothetical protein
MHFVVLSHHVHNLTCSQLLEGFKCESQTENSGNTRSPGTLLGLQHYRGVEGHAGAPRWDSKEVTSFIHSHRLAQNQHKMVRA